MSSFWVDLLGAEMRFVATGAIRTRSISAGSGQPLILLHGTGATAETFARNVVPLAQHFEVHALDLMGHGLSTTGGLPLSRDALVGQVVDYLDARGIGSAHLLGLSLGGWVATWTALRHPERVDKLVNVVGAHLALPLSDADAAAARAGSERLRTLTKRFVEQPNRETLRARLGYVFLDPDAQIDDELLETRWALHQRSQSGPQIAAFVGNPGAETLLTPERLRDVRHPTLFLWTDHNPSTPAVAARAAAALVADGQFALMEGCGHWPQWEDTPRFNAIVSSFLSAA